MATTDTTTPRRALFPGSFNPFTIGHASIVERGMAMFDEIVIAVGYSVSKHTAEDVSRRVEAIRRVYAGVDKVKVVTYDSLTVEAAEAHGCRFILRGIRNMVDFEYERNMAMTNRQLAGIETVILFTLPELAAVSSSLVRELEHFGRDVTPFLPKPQTDIDKE